jgi:hypothetical protein
LCELSLGHTVGDETERAYARSDGYRKRITIMERWANFLATREKSSGKVLNFARANA